MSEHLKLHFMIGIPCLLFLLTTFFTSGCQAPADTNVIEKEKFIALNPESWYSPFEAHPLSPRFDTLEGKIIGIAGEHEPLLYLKEELERAVTGLKVVYLEGNVESLHPLEGLSRYPNERNPNGFSKPVLEELKETRIDTLIRGIAH
jgi:hypothetical protein